MWGVWATTGFGINPHGSRWAVTKPGDYMRIFNGAEVSPNPHVAPGSTMFYFQIRSNSTLNFFTLNSLLSLKEFKENNSLSYWPFLGLLVRSQGRALLLVTLCPPHVNLLKILSVVDLKMFPFTHSFWRMLSLEEAFSSDTMNHHSIVSWLPLFHTRSWQFSILLACPSRAGSAWLLLKFSLYLWFQQSSPEVLSCGILVFINLEVYWVTWSCRFSSNFENLQLFLQYIFSTWFSLSSL